MKKFNIEKNLIGYGFIIIFYVCVLLQAFFFSGMDISLEAEVIFPLLIMILTWESVKIRSDVQYQFIRIYENSFLAWIFRRYIYVFGVLAFSYLCFLFLRNVEFKIYSAFIINSVFFTSIVMLGGVYLKNTYTSIGIGSLIGITAILWKSLSEYKYSQYIYPFNLWANNNVAYGISKLNLLIVSLLIWMIISSGVVRQ